MKIFFVITLCFVTLFGEQFSDILPPPTPIMIKNQYNAKECANPANANKRYESSFRYGCFCGEDYPDIKHSSLQDYKKLTTKQREELIEEYFKIKPYDAIDTACMNHDICFIYQAKEDQACNDALYMQLKKIENLYRADLKSRNYDTKEKRCQILASDMSSVFKTVFGAGDNISDSELFIFGMTTPFSFSAKMFQKMGQSMTSSDDYPLEGERCDIEIK